MIRLERVIDTLPDGFEVLRAEARSEGYRMLDTLSAEWASGATRFDHPGEALFAAHAGDILAGIGGLTVEPAITGALRMRRFTCAPPAAAAAPVSCWRTRCSICRGGTAGR